MEMPINESELKLRDALVSGDKQSRRNFIRIYGPYIYTLCCQITGKELSEESYLAFLCWLKKEDFSPFKKYEGKYTFPLFISFVVLDFFAKNLVSLLEGKDKEQAWEGIRRYCGKGMKRVIKKYVFNNEEYDDYYQEVMKVLCEDDFARLRKYEMRGNFWGFLNKIIKNICIDIHRKKNTNNNLKNGETISLSMINLQEYDLSDNSSSPEEIIKQREREDLREKIKATILEKVRSMEGEKFLFFRLKYYSDPPLKPKEIARIMKRDINVVYKIHDHLIEKLRKEISKEYPGLPMENIF